MMMGEEKNSLAWMIIALLAAVIFVGIWFVVPEYREEILGIPEKKEIKQITIDVNKIIGEYDISPVTLSYNLPFLLKFVVEENLRDSGRIELSSNIFKISEKTIHVPEGSYLILNPVKINGILEISYDGIKEKLVSKKKIFGPSDVRITNKLKFFQFFGTSIIDYEIYDVLEEPLYPSKEINFESDFDVESSLLEISFSGNCDVRILVNGKEVFNGRLLEDRLNLGGLKAGNIRISFFANKGCDCEINDLKLTLYPSEIPKIYEKAFGKVEGERVKIILDILERSEDVKVYMTFIGKNYYNFNLTDDYSVEIDKEDLSDRNIIRLKVEDGYIFLKRIRVIGE